MENVLETAAIAISEKTGGPSKLVIYVVLELANGTQTVDTCKDILQDAMQMAIRTKLNPLFGISDIVITRSLPRTASNKIMRRVLRDNYNKTS